MNTCTIAWEIANLDIEIRELYLNYMLQDMEYQDLWIAVHKLRKILTKEVYRFFTLTEHARACANDDHEGFDHFRLFEAVNKVSEIVENLYWYIEAFNSFENNTEFQVMEFSLIRRIAARGKAATLFKY